MTVTIGLNSICDTGESSSDLITGDPRFVFNFRFSDGLVANQLVYVGYLDDDSMWQQFELGDEFGAHKVSAAEVAANHLNFGTALDPFEDGVWTMRAWRTELDGTAQTEYSNTLVVSLNTVAPIVGEEMLRLTAPGTTATFRMTTDQTGGKVYYVICTSPQDSITAAQIIAGHDASNGTPAKAGNQNVTASGIQDITATGVPADTIVFCYAAHRNALGNDSNVGAVSWLQSQVGWSPEGTAGNLRLYLDVDDTATMTLVNIGGNLFCDVMADKGPYHHDVVGNPLGGVNHNAQPVLVTKDGLPALWFVNNGAKSMSLNRDTGFAFRSKKATFLWIGRADDSFYGRMFSLKTAESTNGDLDFPGLAVGWLENGANPVLFNVGTLYPDPHFNTGTMPNAGGWNAVLVCFSGTLGEIFVASGGQFVSQGTFAFNTFIGSSVDNGLRIMMGHLDQMQNLQGHFRLGVITSSNEKPDLSAIYDFAKAHTPLIP